MLSNEFGRVRWVSIRISGRLAKHLLESIDERLWNPVQSVADDVRLQRELECEHELECDHECKLEHQHSTGNSSEDIGNSNRRWASTGHFSGTRAGDVI